MITDLQGFTFNVTHRSGKVHLDADAISRLLQIDEDPYINNADDLRDDLGPLTEKEKEGLLTKYLGFGDADKIADIIDTFRMERLREAEEDDM
jgi:hypothetical protein